MSDAEWPETAIETRLGIAPLEMLAAERTTLVDRSADLASWYGPFGGWDAQRKTLLSAIKNRIRAEAHKLARKMSEAQLDDEAHADPDYTDFLTRTLHERAEWVRAANRIQSVTDRIMRGQMLGRYVSSEPKL